MGTGGAADGTKAGHLGRCPAFERPAHAPGCRLEVLADRPEGTVVRRGLTVAKAHAPDGPAVG
ncbi:hypothetical protein [Streptomyces sp. NPDC048612]|uniref:hypothetical protein n=1 Tax=Streptomyces sp. NPDC048612 TaxID=3365579 RepID=UPI00371C1EF5